MKNANTLTLGFLAVGLFLSGLVFADLPGLARLGLILAGVICACNIAVINEIRQAREEITKKIERRLEGS